MLRRVRPAEAHGMDRPATPRTISAESPPLADADVTPVAMLLADSARAAMLWAMSDGRALPAGELARLGRVRASAASAHLARLTASGLVTVERHGRHRYYRLAEPAVVAALEALAAIAPPARAAGARDAHAAAAIRRARTCYDHLAGHLGVGIAEALVGDGTLRLDGREFLITPGGATRLRSLGIDVPAVADVARRSRRPIGRACLDWSERRYHVAGPLGAALTARFLDAGWVARTPASRALRITNEGRRALRRHFDLRLL
jgi:DNA-binding transcriptional ArsR family regulator